MKQNITPENIGKNLGRLFKKLKKTTASGIEKSKKAAESAKKVYQSFVEEVKRED
jgi:hypothetical protein